MITHIHARLSSIHFQSLLNKNLCDRVVNEKENILHNAAASTLYINCPLLSINCTTHRTLKPFSAGPLPHTRYFVRSDYTTPSDR